MASGAAAVEDMEDKELASLMEELGIVDEEFDDLVYEDEVEENAPDPRWLAIGKVHTTHEYGDFWFYKNMRNAWDLAQTVKFRSLGNNLYTMQFTCLGDWNKVMEGGPWAFRGQPVLLAPYDGFTKPSSIDLNTFKIWIQIHDLPDGYEKLMKPLAEKVGVFYAEDKDSGDFAGNFYRARVILDVRNPLKNHVSIVRKKKRQIFKVKYERLPDWCAVCGMIGHLHTAHGDGVHAASKLIFKELRASWSGRAGGRNTMQNQDGAPPADPSANTTALVAMEVDNKSSSGANPDETDTSRKRDTTEKFAQPAANAQVTPAGAVAAIPPSPSGKPDPKRVRIGANSVPVANIKTKNLNISAGSPEGLRREQ